MARSGPQNWVQMLDQRIIYAFSWVSAKVIADLNWKANEEELTAAMSVQKMGMQIFVSFHILPGRNWIQKILDKLVRQEYSITQSYFLLSVVSSRT